MEAEALAAGRGRGDDDVPARPRRPPRAPAPGGRRAARSPGPERPREARAEDGGEGRVASPRRRRASRRRRSTASPRSWRASGRGRPRPLARTSTGGDGMSDSLNKRTVCAQARVRATNDRDEPCMPLDRTRPSTRPPACSSQLRGPEAARGARPTSSRSNAARHELARVRGDRCSAPSAGWMAQGGRTRGSRASTRPRSTWPTTTSGAYDAPALKIAFPGRRASCGCARSGRCGWGPRGSSTSCAAPTGRCWC